MPPTQAKRGRGRRNADKLNEEGATISVPHTRGEVPPGSERVNDANEPPTARVGVEGPPQPRWTLDSTVREVLLAKVNLTETVKVNDFLRDNVGGRGVVNNNENVTMEAFLLKPAMYIQDEELRDHITALPALRGVKEDMKLRDTLRETARNLERVGVYSLQQWEKITGNKKIDLMAKGILDAALNAAKREILVPQSAASKVIEGAYESVLNATWHYVEGVDDDGRGFGMQVKEGKPPTVWTDSEVMRGSLEEDDADEKPVDGRLELMVLTSKNGWPCTVFSTKKSCDVYVNREVMRAWRIVLKDVDECLGNTVNANKELTPYVLMGTPGIGKSFAAGSFLLHQLLRYDAERLPVVAYFIDGGAYLFEKNSDGGRVAWYKNEDMAVSVVEDSFKQNEGNEHKRGYIIYDVDRGSTGPPNRLPPSGWGIIVITPPNEDKYEEWKTQKRAEWIIMNCPTPHDIKAICAWENRNNQGEEREDYWKKVRERVDDIGPLPRYIFNDDAYEQRRNEVDSAVHGISASNVSEYRDICDGNAGWKDKGPSHKLVKIYREHSNNRDKPKNRPLTDALRRDICTNVDKSSQDRYPASPFTPRGAPDLGLMEEIGIFAFLNGNFVANLAAHLRIIPPPGGREGEPSVLQGRRSAPFVTRGYADFPLSKSQGTSCLQFDLYKLYADSSSEFPLVDGFYFVLPSKRSVRLVGIRMITDESREITAATVANFKESLDTSFSPWLAISVVATWEIIFIHLQKEDESRQTREWQSCTLSPSGRYSAEEQNAIIEFWNEKVNQYHVN